MAVELQGVSRYYGKTSAIANISLHIEDGQFCVLVGRSGCGKSTLLRSIAGLETVSEGKIYINDVLVNNLPARERDVAMVFQNYALYPHFTVAENLAFGLKMRKTEKKIIDQKVQTIAQSLGIAHLLPRKPKQLSGGQQQRVALGRAIIRQPQAFLLDEPLSNLDALLREQVRSQLKQIFKSQNKPVVYVTHDQTEAMTLSTRIALLNDGVLQQLDTPHQIYNYPANTFVAGFIGSPQMNLMTLNCQEKQAMLGEFGINLPPLENIPSQVILGIRPEDVRLATEEDQQVVKGTVTLVEDLGKEQLLTVEVAGSPDKQLRSLIPSDQSWDSDQVALALPPNSLHWFDVNSGQRLNGSL